MRFFDVESLSDDEIAVDVGELQSLLRRLKELCVPHLEVHERTREFVSKETKGKPKGKPKRETKKETKGDGARY